jgi:hypothetical protein
MIDIVIHIVNWDARTGRRGVRHLARRTREAETPCAGWIDAYGAGAAGVGGTASTLYGKLPVCTVGFVAGGEGRVGCADVLGRCGVAAARVSVSSVHLIGERGFAKYVRCPTGRYSGFLAIGVSNRKRVAYHAAAPGESNPA